MVAPNASVDLLPVSEISKLAADLQGNFDSDPRGSHLEELGNDGNLNMSDSLQVSIIFCLVFSYQRKIERLITLLAS